MKKSNVLKLLLGIALLSSCIGYPISTQGAELKKTPRWIIGSDDRIIVGDTTKAPYNSMVFIEISGGKIGSGVLISPDTVLTAAHVVYNSATKSFASSITVYPGFNAGVVPFGSAKAKAMVLPTEYQKEASFDYDYAIVKLDRNLNVGATGIAGFSSFTDLPITISGYHGDLGGKMSTQTGHIKEYNEKTLVYDDLDTLGGSSGAPVYDARNYIVGVNVGGIGIIYPDGTAEYKNIASRMGGEALDKLGKWWNFSEYGNFSGGYISWLPADYSPINNLDDISTLTLPINYRNSGNSPWFDIQFKNGAQFVNSETVHSENKNVVEYLNYDNNIARFKINGVGSTDIVFYSKDGTQKYTKKINITKAAAYTNVSLNKNYGVATANILTNNQQFSLGALMTSQKIDLTHDFVFDTTLGIGSGQGDGVSFVIKNTPSANSFGGSGDGLGVSGLSQTLAISLRHQSWYSPPRNSVSFYDGNFKNYVNTTPGTGTNSDLHVRWTASTQTLSYVYRGVTSSYRLNDLNQFFGGTSAYVGLVGVTGQASNVHLTYSPRLTAVVFQ
ncbi:trypsin-like serine protease [Listeria booriae]|uniref:Serine protease n=1 Tax=Listeria booriae TaxID=1552123 RepID=A0A841YRC5_9LIST|nr:trypsin-like peptidase domain-containing protein [Listeria booriae]MBC1403085.1 trypsin-like serine protease [Listeria booriae]MBC1618119.1 trypsin-like serine protease [Listeria booriae]